MKKILSFLTILTMLTACKEKIISCEDIGNNVKWWSVYNLKDSISMHDQYGNPKLIKITEYYNKAPYLLTERGSGFMKKLAKCESSLSLSNQNDFRIEVDGKSFEADQHRKPNHFYFKLQVGDLISNFFVDISNNIPVAYTNDTTASIKYSYTSGNTVYSEAFVNKLDTTISTGNVYRVVYALDKGLVEYSTRNPARTFTID